jgi:adenylate cyclase
MGTEIERKFLVQPGAWTPQGAGVAYRQGYLSTDKDRVVRVRIEGDAAKLTIKGRTHGLSRAEYEVPLPLQDAAEMLDRLCHQPVIDKHRHVEWHHGKRWEIDVFHRDNEGLVVAELELQSEDEAFEAPHWLGPEVSHDPRYFNASLQTHPYNTWRDAPAAG